MFQKCECQRKYNCPAAAVLTNLSVTGIFSRAEEKWAVLRSEGSEEGRGADGR